VFASVKISVPPVCATVPLPEIALPIVAVPVRLNIRAALFTTPPEPSVPLLDHSPTCSVPTLIMVPPLYVLVPLRTNVPVPILVKATVPDPSSMTPENVPG